MLRTARLLLRGYEIADASAIYDYASDELTTRYMAWDRHTSIDGVYDFLDGWVAENYRREQLDYAICLASDPKRVIGGMGVLLRSAQHNTMELGYILNRAHWGNGFGPEAGRHLIQHAFASHDAERISAPVLAENTRSRRMAEKLGMKLDGVMRSALLLRGRRWDEAIYSILRNEL